MNKNSKKPDINTDNGTATFMINMSGDVNNHSYLGSFTVKCVLSPLDQIEADKAYREMLGEHMIMASEAAKDHSFALAQLHHRVLEYPPFWKTPRILGNLEDTNVIIEVLNLAIAAQQGYMAAKKKEKEDIEKKLTDRMKKNMIEKEPEAESIEEKVKAKEEEVDLDN